MARTRMPFGPTQAPTGSTLGLVLWTAILLRIPGSRATLSMTTVPSWISETSSSNSRFKRPG